MLSFRLCLRTTAIDTIGHWPNVKAHVRSNLRSNIDTVHVQRCVEHKVPTLMHSVHSDGANCESLLKVARAIEYTATVEAVFGKPTAEDAAP